MDGWNVTGTTTQSEPTQSQFDSLGWGWCRPRQEAEVCFSLKSTRMTLGQHLGTAGVLPELQEAAVSLSPAVKLYSKTVRQDNSSFSTSCQSGLHAVCSMQKMDQQYPEETNTNSYSTDMWKVSLTLIHPSSTGRHKPCPQAHLCLLCSSTPSLLCPNTLDCLCYIFVYIWPVFSYFYSSISDSIVVRRAKKEFPCTVTSASVWHNKRRESWTSTETLWSHGNQLKMTTSFWLVDG